MKSGTVLIAYEDAYTSAFVEKQLKTADTAIQYIHCTSDEKLLDFLQRSDTDHIRYLLLDMNMIRRSHSCLLLRMADHPAWKRIPTIVLSDNYKREEVLYCYHAGAKACVQQPADPDLFDHVLSSIHRFWCGVNVVPQMGH